MTSKLTKREKVLLYLLLCLAILAGTVCLLVLPAITRNSTMRNDLDAVVMEKQQAELKQAALSKNQERLASLEAEGESLYDQMFTDGDMPETLDLFVTGIALQAGVAPESLVIGSREYTPIQNYAGDTASEDASSSASSAVSNSADEPHIMLANIQISGSCDAAAFIRMTDAFASKKQLIIAESSFSEGGEGSPSQFHMTLEIYLLAE